MHCVCTDRLRDTSMPTKLGDAVTSVTFIPDAEPFWEKRLPL